VRKGGNNQSSHFHHKKRGYNRKDLSGGEKKEPGKYEKEDEKTILRRGPKNIDRIYEKEKTTRAESSRERYRKKNKASKRDSATNIEGKDPDVVGEGKAQKAENLVANDFTLGLS